MDWDLGGFTELTKFEVDRYNESMRKLERGNLPTPELDSAFIFYLFLVSYVPYNAFIHREIKYTYM